MTYRYSFEASQPLTPAQIAHVQAALNSLPSTMPDCEDVPDALSLLESEDCPFYPIFLPSGSVQLVVESTGQILATYRPGSLTFTYTPKTPAGHRRSREVTRCRDIEDACQLLSDRLPEIEL
jgi:hypothetical protein